MSSISDPGAEPQPWRPYPETPDAIRQSRARQARITRINMSIQRCLDEAGPAAPDALTLGTALHKALADPEGYTHGLDSFLDAHLAGIGLLALTGAARGGKARTAAKLAASRANGAKGGRPRSPQRSRSAERAPTAGLGLTALAGEAPTAPPAGLGAAPKAVELPGGPL